MAFVDIPVLHGRLEALLWEAEAPRYAAVVLHPHPVQGGTMHNHLVYRLADAFRSEGAAALRFNFRGVGRSTGAFDEGRGELEDAQAALQFLRERYPNARAVVSGFSFGAGIGAALAATDSGIDRLLLAGLPLDLFDFEGLKSDPRRKAFIQADRDEFGPLERIQALVEALPEPKRLFVVPNATHLAERRLEAFASVAHDAVQWLLAG